MYILYQNFINISTGINLQQKKLGFSSMHIYAMQEQVKGHELECINILYHTGFNSILC